MKQFKKNLGKVSLTPEGIWDDSKEYEILSIVSDKNTKHGFISKREVPAGVDLYNTDYWMPLNVSGYADNNMIIYNDKNEEGEIIDYVLEEAIKSVAEVGRKPGLILCFYNKNNDRLDIGACWEIWQYTGGTSDEWENLELWRNIYYNYNQFVGWYRNETMLRKHSPYPEIGCYAYVGTVLNDEELLLSRSTNVFFRVTSDGEQEYRDFDDMLADLSFYLEECAEDCNRECYIYKLCKARFYVVSVSLPYLIIFTVFLLCAHLSVTDRLFINGLETFTLSPVRAVLCRFQLNCKIVP